MLSFISQIIKGVIMKAIVSVLGKDNLGIIAKVSTALYEDGINIIDISQKIMQGYFTMISLVEVPDTLSMEVISDKMSRLGNELGVEIKIQHEDIFNSMHKI